jgi:hypothetical protein
MMDNPSNRWPPKLGSALKDCNSDRLRSASRNCAGQENPGALLLLIGQKEGPASQLLLSGKKKPGTGPGLKSLGEDA